MSEENQDLERRYVQGQAIEYFLLSILIMFAATRVKGTGYVADKPIFFLERSDLMPFPFPVLNIRFDLGYWLIAIMALALLCLSLYFLIALFGKGRTSNASKIGSYLSPFIGIFMLLSFVLSWLEGLSTLLGNLQVR